MENLNPSSEPYTPTVLPEATAFEPVMSRIQVPASPQYPDGEAVCLQLYTLIGGPLVFVMPPASARDIGQGLIDTANRVEQIVLPTDNDIRKLLDGT